MFPYAEFVLYTLGMIAWINKHPSRKLLLVLGISWIIGKIAEGFFYGRPWHIHYEWTMIIIILIAWAKIHKVKGYLPFFLSTLTIAGQYLFILNEPGILPYQDWLFPLMFIIITWLAAQNFWDLVFALCGALLINQVFVIFFFQGVIRYQELPEPYFWNSTILFLTILALIRYNELWPSQDSQVTVEQIMIENTQFDLDKQ